MNIQGKPYKSIELWDAGAGAARIIDQRRLPFELAFVELKKVEDYAHAIREMLVRGAPLIGATAAFGMWSAACENTEMKALAQAAETLKATRPTAVDLFHAVDRLYQVMAAQEFPENRIAAALSAAQALVAESESQCFQIGQHGLGLIQAASRRKNGEPVQILTHCNAGWLACIDYGTATAPIYAAHDAGIPVHVWVDETRPRNQGAHLTAFELGEHGVPHTVITDNAGGHLMQHGLVDMVIVGTDRTTRCGDVANKIGTYLKALAAHDNGIPFYVAAPSTSIDWHLRDGLAEIPIEQRHPDEVHYLQGKDGDVLRKVRITPDHSPAANYGFDVTPARLVTGILTERGICSATEEGLVGLFPEKK